MKKLFVSISCALATLTADASSIPSFEQVSQFNNPIIIVNGYKIRYIDYPKIKPEFIESIIELEPEDAIKVFGEQGAYGAIIIKLIPRIKSFSMEGAKIDDKIIEKVADYAALAKQREQARLAAEAEKARLEAIEKIRLEEENARRLEMQEKIKLEIAEEDKVPEKTEAENTRKETAEKARLETEENARKEAAEKARLEAEENAR